MRQTQTNPADNCHSISIAKNPDQQMKKFKVFRSLVKVDENVRKHELVAVEYGRDIRAVTDKLIKAINADATGLPQFEKGCTAYSMAPEETQSGRRVKRYQYYVTAVLEPDFGDQNKLIEYGIMVEEMNSPMEKEEI